MTETRGSYGNAIDDDFIAGADERARQYERTQTDHQVMLNVRVDPKMRRDLKRRAVDEDRAMRDIIVEALTQYLEKPEPDFHGLDDDGI